MSEPSCDITGHCITCGDEAIAMRVLEVHAAVALCVDAGGERHEVAIDLIEPVTLDQQVLVHAGVAIG